METPMYYLNNAIWYKTFIFIIFIVAIFLSLFQKTIPIWLALIIPFVMFFISAITGRNLAVKKLRKILNELATNTDTQNEKDEIEEDLKLNNLELFQKFSKIGDFSGHH